MWPLGTSFSGLANAPALFIKPRRLVRDLDGLPAVLGRFGPYEVRLATTKREIRRAQRLRYEVFFEEGGAAASQALALARRDICPFDAFSDHLLVIDRDSVNRFGRPKPKIVGTYRLLRRDIAERNLGFYSQREFDLAPLLARHPQTRFLELGRSCVHRQYRSKRAIELLWRGLWLYAKHHRIDALIGCASLPGIDPRRFAMPLSFLHHQASAPSEWSVRPVAGRAIDMNIMARSAIDARRGVAALPPLVKAYLRVGAKFGDGAVIDAQFGTIDVFTIMPLADIEDRYISYYGGPMDGPESTIV